MLRTKLQKLLSVFLLVFLTIGSVAFAQVEIVDDGVAQAVVVIPKQADDLEQWSAEFLCNTIEKSTGVRLQIKLESEPLQANAIFIGKTKESNKFNDKLKPLNRDGFVMSQGDGKVVIVGKTPVGTEYGVYEFLERYLGVRWLFPGEIGTSIPKHKKVNVPDGLWVSQPAFISRQLSDFSVRGRKPRENDNDTARFMRYNRMRRGVMSTECLFRLFAPKKFALSHPEFYPIRDGKRFIPPDNDQRFWQPCFTATGSAEAAAKQICDFFRARPDELSRTVGINDTSADSHWCQCASCKKLDGDRRNSLGLSDRSRSYFTWANRVSEIVCEQYPDKKLGFLAYCNLIDSPSEMKLHPALVPFVTYDRMKWLNPNLREKDQLRTLQWHNKLPDVGWYDYIYGTFKGAPGYIAPRVYFHLMGDYISWAHANGVKHYYAEAYPAEDWHEGPKLYLLLKLLWNPYVDVDEVLNDWYVAAVGPEAAPHLAAYFNMWEEIWTKRVPTTKWFQNQASRRQFLDFRSNAYMDVITQNDLEILDEHINEMQKAVKGEGNKKRVKFIADAAKKRLKKISGIIQTRYMQANPDKFPWKKIEIQSSFDRGFDGWDTWSPAFAKGKFVWTNKKGHEKQGALVINATGANKGSMVLFRDIPIERGRSYRLSAYINSSGFEDDNRIMLSIIFKTKDGKTLRKIGSFDSYTDSLNSGTWERINLVVNIPENDPLWKNVYYARCCVAAKGAGSGTLMVDNVIFGEINTP